MPSLKECAKKFGKALSGGDLKAIEAMGGDAQGYLDQLKAERDQKFPQALSQKDRWWQRPGSNEPLSETQEARGGVNVRRLVELLGDQLYENAAEIPLVTVKELFQNAFDGVKEVEGRPKEIIRPGDAVRILPPGREAEARWLQSGRKVIINTSILTNEIEVIDNGVGMTPDIVTDAFLTIAGTDKGTGDRASGGFGIAKILFLYGNETIELDTVRDGVRTRLNSTGKDIMESSVGGTPLELIIDRDVDLPNGTTVKIKVPENYTDRDTGESKPILFPSSWAVQELLNESPLFEDVETIHNGKIIDNGINFPKDDYTTYANVKFNWGNVRVIVSKDEQSFRYSDRNSTILSNGIFQFENKLRFGTNPFEQSTVPYKFYFNIEPTIKAGKPGYPIAPNRQSFTVTAQKDVDRLYSYISQRHYLSTIGDSIQSYGNLEVLTEDGDISRQDLTPPRRTDTSMFRVNTGGEIVIEDGRMTVDGEHVPEIDRKELQEFKPDMSEFKIDQSMVDSEKPFIHANATLDGENVTDVLRREFGFERVNKYLFDMGDIFRDVRNLAYEFGGRQYSDIDGVPVGVTFDRLYGVHFPVPFRGMAINPGITTMDGMGPLFRAQVMYSTMIHEVTHFAHMDHSPSFITENQRLAALFIAHEKMGNNASNPTELVNRIAENIANNEDIYDRLNRAYDDGSMANSETKLDDNVGQPIEGSRAFLSAQGTADTGQPDSAQLYGEAGPDTGRDTEGELDGAVDSQPEGPIDNITSDITRNTPKGPQVLSQDAQRNEQGFYSAVEQAVLDMNLPEWKKEGGTARGKVIWQKLRKGTGVKVEELKWLGLEEFLTADPSYKFPRDVVVEFIQANGIKVEEVMADGDPIPDEPAYEVIRYDEGTAETGRQNYEHIIEDDMYVYDNDPETQSEFFKTWVKENIEDDVFQDRLKETIEETIDEPLGPEAVKFDIVETPQGNFQITPRWVSDNTVVENQTKPIVRSREEAQDRINRIINSPRVRKDDEGLVLLNRFDSTTTTRQNEDFDPTLKDLIANKDWDGVIERVGLRAIAPEAREDYETNAEKRAEESYMESPVMTYQSQNTDSVVTITGNDDIGYAVNIDDTTVDLADPPYNLPDAQAMAADYAAEMGVVVGDPINVEPIGGTRYGEWVAEGESSNYREQKLIMPDIEGDFYHTEHFPDRNVVAFNRMTDRQEGNVRELRLEEIQSDWDSQARKGVGYQTGESLEVLIDELESVESNIRRLLGRIYRRPLTAIGEIPELDFVDAVFAELGDTSSETTSESLAFRFPGWFPPRVRDRMAEPTRPLTEEDRSSFDELIELSDKRDNLIDRRQAELHGEVNQPYKGNAWVNLGLKYAIREAINGGYEQLAWSDNATVQGTWSPGYSYAAQYDKKMPSMVKKLTGQTPRHVQYDGSPMPPYKEYTPKFDEETQLWRVVDENDQGRLVPGFSPQTTETPARTVIADMVPDGKWDIDITEDVKAKFAERQTLFQDDVPTPTEDRGEIQMLDGERIIRLSKSSDLSTFLHETAHLFMEVEKQFAAEFGTTSNHEAILNWLGASSLDEITAATPEGVEMHEKFARAFEAYLREGKAPSVELRDAFSAFRSWLMKIYTYITQLNVELDDDIRTIFDRMLATEAEILEASSTPAFEGLFTSIEQSDMTEEQWENYQKLIEQRKNRTTETVDQKLMEELTARKTKEWKDEKKPLIEEETERLSNEPRYQLFADLNKAPFDYDLLMAALDGVTKLPGRLIGKAKKEGGVDPAEYAEYYGYDTVAEMVEDIVEMPLIKKAAEEAAQARMIEMYGDIINDGTLEAEVLEALHSDTAARVLIAELEALKPKQKRKINRESLKVEAKNIISSMTYKQIKPNKYYRAEIRAAQRAVNAKGDEAYDAKVAQLENHYLYREALEARKAMERQRRYVKGVQKRKYNTNSVDDEFIANLKALSNAYDMGTNPDRQRAALNGILSWFNDMGVKGEVEMHLMDPNLVLAMEARARGEMGSFNLPSFDDLTASDLRGLYEMLRHLRFVGGQISKLQNSEVAAERSELKASINANGGRDVVDPERVGRKAPAWDQVKFLVNKLPSLRNLIRKLDGFDKQSEGVANRLIYRLVEDSTNDKLDLTDRIYDKFQAELNDIHRIGLSKRKESTIITEAGNKVSMNYEELFMLALYWGTESSREAIREGHGLTDGDVERLLTNLSNEQLEMVNAVWNVNESLWPDLSSASVKRYGVSPEKLDATPFEVNGIAMSGGHMRLYYNSLEIELANEQKQGDQYANIVPSKAGSLRERVGSGGRPVLLDRNNITRSLEESVHFIAFSENSQKIRRIINAKDVQESIQRKHGVPFHRALIEQLDQLTRNQKARETYPGLAASFRLLRRAATYRHLVLSIKNIVQQTSALPIAASEVGPVNLSNAAMTIMFDGGAAKDSILEKSAFMRNRTSLVNREAAEYLKQLSVAGKFATQWQRFANIGFAPQTFVDAMIAFPTWLAKYEAGMNDHGDQRRAVSDADIAVSESVGSGADIHLGGAFSSNSTEFARTMTLFGSWFNAYYQRMYRETKGFSEASPAGFNTIVTMPLIVGVLSSMLVMDFPDDDSDESWAKYIATRYAVFLSGTLPIVRDVVSFAYSGFTPKTVLAGAQESPTKLFSEVESFVSGDQSALKTASDVTKVVSTFVPIPGSGQVTKVADFVDSYNKGNEGDITPLNVYQALVEGPDRNK